ncbi:response regulator [Tropicibacter sp. R15_0]|uniref:ATP-binding protein n=1 Tax=Tropicibacter sp. R15_0 TaxID=2821101 RepID=UPI001ADC213B|nr:response regulator [Tropicibacter sp. R15_0]
MSTWADSDTGETGKMRRGLTAVIVILFITIILLLVMDVRRQLERLAYATSDNVQWFLAQSESEALSLELAAQKALRTETPDLANLKTRFDIFYSRVDTLQSGPTFAPLREKERIRGNITYIGKFLTKWVAIIDAQDDRLENSLEEFARDASLARTANRQIALAGIKVFSEIRDAQRASISQTLTRIAILTIALVTVLIIVVLAMFRLAQIREQDAQTNLEISERMEAIIATSLDAIVVTNRDGEIVEYNGAAERMFGYPRDVALSQNFVDLILPEPLRENLWTQLMQFKAANQQNLGTLSSLVNLDNVKLEAQHQDGQVFPIELALARTHSRDGEIFVGFIRDISTRLRAEEAMRDARDRAIAGEKHKADLLAVMSHEMRTPLNGMLGTMELFEPEKMNDEHRHYLGVMQKSGQILLRHVNDVLDVSRLDAGKMNLRHEAFDLVELLEELIEGQNGRAKARGNRLTLSPMHPALHEVHGDPDRLRQILLNLLGNAIKFTENGEITIEADCQNGLDEVEIRVIDTGLGISQEDLDRVFGDFVTIDSSYARSNTGTGLGLGISHRLVTALGGDMGAESELGEGSVFWLRLSLAYDAEKMERQPLADVAGDAGAGFAPEAEQNTALPAPMQVLLVEDNPVNRMVARKLLERDGHSVTEAEDGLIGVEKALQGEFDVILMDISMPGMDGLTATDEIRKQDQDTPIIATTAHALPTEAARFIGAGMNAVLIKPMTKTALRQALLNCRAGQKFTLSDLNFDQSLLNTTVLDEFLDEIPKAQVRNLLTKFTEEMTAFLADLPPQKKRLDAFAAEAHRMAGSAGVFGANRLNILLRTCQEEALKGSRSLPPYIEQLPDTWAATYAEFEKLGLVSAPAEGKP